MLLIWLELTTTKTKVRSLRGRPGSGVRGLHWLSRLSASPVLPDTSLHVSSARKGLWPFFKGTDSRRMQLAEVGCCLSDLTASVYKSQIKGSTDLP